MAWDFYNLITKVPYLIMLGFGLTVVLGIWVNGLQDVSVRLDRNSLSEYDKVIAAERIQNYEGERTAVNMENFESENGRCYSESFSDLNGDYLSFQVSSEVSDTILENDYSVECIGSLPADQSFTSKIILDNKTNRIPATIYVYEN